jgi:hypothetical protein
MMKWDLPPGDKPKLKPQRWLGISRTTWRFSSLGEASINIYNWRISAAMFDYRKVYAIYLHQRQKSTFFI